MMVVALFCLLVFQEAGQEPYYVVMSNKKVMKVQGPPECQGTLCKVTQLNGQVISLPAKMIDMAETESYNQRLAEKKAQEEQEAAARAEAEAKAQAKRDERRRKRQGTISLSVDDELKKFQPSYTLADGPTSEEGAPAEDASGPPRVETFQSDNPVYISKETITPFPDRHQIEVEVTCRNATGAQKVRVIVKINYANEPADTLEKAVNRDMAANDTVVVSFEAKADQIIQTSYEVRAALNQ